MYILTFPAYEICLYIMIMIISKPIFFFPIAIQEDNKFDVTCEVRINSVSIFVWVMCVVHLFAVDKGLKGG